MTVLVPRFRRTPSVRGVKATQPVGASTWGDMARLHNWTKGQPRCLVPGISSGAGVTYDEADDLTLALRFYPSGYHHTRLWSLRGTGGGEIDVTIGSLDTRTYTPTRIPSTSGLAIPRLSSMEVVEELASMPTGMSAVDVDVRIQVQESVGSLTLMDLRCWEVPHPYLADDDGQATARIISGQPITADLVSELRSGAADMQIGHRMLGAYAVPYGSGATPATTTAFAASTTSGTFGNLWDDTVPCLTRNTTQAPGGGAERLYADVFAWVNSGEAELTIEAENGGIEDVSAATTVSATAPTWVTVGPLEVETEDLSTTAGLPTGTGFESVFVNGRVTTATTLYVASAVLYESTT